MRSPYLAADAGAERLFRSRGYTYVRTFYRMIADLDAPPRAAWPEGIELSTLDPGGERGLSRGAPARPLPITGAPWRGRWTSGSPASKRESLRSGALVPRREAGEAGEPAAALLCSQSFGIGWIGLLGTRPAFRRRGLDRALLLHAFAELYARGERRIGLGVDATNETGATRLYESVGMRVALQEDVCESPPL